MLANNFYDFNNSYSDWQVAWFLFPWQLVIVSTVSVASCEVFEEMESADIYLGAKENFEIHAPF